MKSDMENNMKYNAHQIESLKAIWKDGFGDDDADIDFFFENAYAPEKTAVIDCGGRPVSAMYLLEGILLPASGHAAETETASESADKDEGRFLKVTYLYALATLKEYRGQGIGKATVRAAAELAFARGADVVALTPGNGRLKEWYQNDGFLGESVNGERAAVSPVFPEEYLKLFEAYNGNRDVYNPASGSRDVCDTVIFETAPGVKCPDFFWGAMMG